MLNNVSLKYNGKFLFKDISLSFKKGSWISIIGESGVGKSTLIRIIAGLDNFGDITGIVSNDFKIAWMGQEDLLYPWLNVLDNILLPITLKNKKPTTDEINKAKKLLNQVGIRNKLNQYPNQLSGGQKQRVALVRTLMIDADLILMDEPFSSLDAMTKRDCQNLFYEMLIDKTVVMVTHDVMESTRLSDEVFVMTGKAPYLKKGVSLKQSAPRDFNSDELMQANKKLWQMLEKSYE